MNPVVGLWLWLACGVVGVAAELWLFATGRHAAPDVLAAVLSRKDWLLTGACLAAVVLMGPIQIATLLATYKRRA